MGLFSHNFHKLPWVEDNIHMTLQQLGNRWNHLDMMTSHQDKQHPPPRIWLETSLTIEPHYSPSSMFLQLHHTDNHGDSSVLGQHSMWPVQNKHKGEKAEHPTMLPGSHLQDHFTISGSLGDVQNLLVSSINTCMATVQMAFSTLGIGQHPYEPPECWQQVEPSGHDAFPPGQTTSCTKDLATNFSDHGITLFPF